MLIGSVDVPSTRSQWELFYGVSEAVTSLSMD